MKKHHREAEKPKRTLIAVPCTDKIDVPFVTCLERLNRVGECRVAYLSGSLVYANRDQLAKMAMADNTDYVLWLDSDMVFDPDMMERFIADMEAGYDIVSCLCFRRRDPWTPVLYKTIRIGLGEDPNITEEYPDYPKDQIFEIDACGFGAVMVRTKVIWDMVKRFHTSFIPVYGFGEDISFCIRAKQMGYKIVCDSRIKVGHLAQTVVNELTYKAIERSKEDAADDQNGVEDNHNGV